MGEVSPTAKSLAKDRRRIAGGSGAARGDNISGMKRGFALAEATLNAFTGILKNVTMSNDGK